LAKAESTWGGATRTGVVECVIEKTNCERIAPWAIEKHSHLTKEQLKGGRNGKERKGSVSGQRNRPPPVPKPKKIEEEKRLLVRGNKRPAEVERPDSFLINNFKKTRKTPQEIAKADGREKEPGRGVRELQLKFGEKKKREKKKV